MLSDNALKISMQPTTQSDISKGEVSHLSQSIISQPYQNSIISAPDNKLKHGNSSIKKMHSPTSNLSRLEALSTNGDY